MAPPITPADVRFWRYVDKEGPYPDYFPGHGRCWIWTGASTPYSNGRYGNFRGHNSRMISSHRFSWELANGPCDAPAIDHLCRVTLCCNPDHLDPCTDFENMRRGFSIASRYYWKLGCGKPGHPAEFDVVWSNGQRGCRSCKHEHYATYERKRKARMAVDPEYAVAYREKTRQKNAARHAAAIG